MVPTTQFATPIPLAVQYWQRDDVHNAEHRKWANADNATRIFKERPELIPEFTKHMQLHDLSAVTKQMQLQQTQMMVAGQMPQGPNPKAEGNGQAFERSNKESGNPADVPKGTGQRAQGRGPE